MRNKELFSIRSVPVEDVLPLRQALLLDGDPGASRFRGDNDDSTLHLAVYRSEQIVAVASVCREARPGDTDTASWRIRGVAVEPELQRFGFGRLLIKLCVEHAQRQNGRLAWCTARESARAFYETLGFISPIPPFTLPAKGNMLFYQMQYRLPDAS